MKRIGIFPAMLSVLGAATWLIVSCGSGGGGGGNVSGIFVYVANDQALHVAAYELNMTNGDLTYIGRVEVPSGRPHSLMVNPEGTRIYSSLLTGDQVAGFEINQADGTLSAIPGSPWAASDYPADGTFSASGGYLYVPNYNSDNIIGYAVEPVTGVLTALPDSPYLTSSGPYASVCAASGYLYATISGTDGVSAYMMSPSTGSLTAAPLASITTSGEPYALVTDPSGQYLYVANWGANNIAAYAISHTTGVLTEVGTSPYATSGQPWSLGMDPLGRYLYSISEEPGRGNLQGFAINPDGTLSSVSGPALAFSEMLDDLSVDPSGTFLLSSNVTENEVWVHRIDPSGGTLSASMNSPFAMSDPYNLVAVEIR